MVGDFSVIVAMLKSVVQVLISTRLCYTLIFAVFIQERRMGTLNGMLQKEIRGKSPSVSAVSNRRQNAGMDLIKGIYERINATTSLKYFSALLLTITFISASLRAVKSEMAY